MPTLDRLDKFLRSHPGPDAERLMAKPKTAMVSYNALSYPNVRITLEGPVKSVVDLANGCLLHGDVRIIDDHGHAYASLRELEDALR